tara:strand:- start:21681 stop:23708 length:2028 start_codon:yes stop_codon:yes gene_type:complete
MNYLTKSKFIQGYNCKRQLYYALNPNEFANSKINDPFLEALAKGGYQVGELAKFFNNLEGVPSYSISTLDTNAAIKETEELLKKDKVVIFEAAFLYKNCLVRADIIQKDGDDLKLIEVKSKSLDPEHFEDVIFDTDKWLEYKSLGRSNPYGGILNRPKAFKNHPEFLFKKEYEKYILDITYQAWVVQKAKPEYNFSFEFCVPNKNSKASVDNLNEFFMIKKDKDFFKVISPKDLSKEDLGDNLLTNIPCTWVTEAIFKNKIDDLLNFDSLVEELSILVELNEKPIKQITNSCKDCPARCDSKDKRNGFNLCMSEETGMEESEVAAYPNVFDLWNNRNSAKSLLVDGFFHLKDYESKETSLSVEKFKPLDRQNLQIEKEKNNDKEFVVLLDSLKKEMNKHEFPLHFIDFETSMMAIPQNKGQSPYQIIAFQYSHHVINEKWEIEHKSQYINLEKGHPNFDFLRNLKSSLGSKGTIFKWSPHEKTVLNKIKLELQVSSESDKEELISFVDELCYSESSRAMVDMWAMYKNYQYIPSTKGSNSIKYVLPAVMEIFDDFKEEFNTGVYGKNKKYKSLNFEEFTWFKEENGKLIDPYLQLPKIFNMEKDDLDRMFEGDVLKDGGAAMVAYGACQFSQITDQEKNDIKEALLRYCELDTFAMVIIYLHWAKLTGNFKGFKE